MFTPVPSSPLSSTSSLRSPTAHYSDYSHHSTTTTEHDVSALTPSLAQSPVVSSRTSDECSVYSNSSVSLPTPAHTLRRAADELEGRSDAIVFEAMRLLREAEIGHSIAERLREMADEASSHLEQRADHDDDVPLESIVPLRRRAE